jgi:hypothetical protein
MLPMIMTTPAMMNRIPMPLMLPLSPSPKTPAPTISRTEKMMNMIGMASEAALAPDRMEIKSAMNLRKAPKIMIANAMIQSVCVASVKVSPKRIAVPMMKSTQATIQRPPKRKFPIKRAAKLAIFYICTRPSLQRKGEMIDENSETSSSLTKASILCDSSVRF